MIPYLLVGVKFGRVTRKICQGDISVGGGDKVGHCGGRLITSVVGYDNDGAAGVGPQSLEETNNTHCDSIPPRCP